MFTFEWVGESPECGIAKVLDRSTTNSRSCEDAIIHAKSLLKRETDFPGGRLYGVRVLVFSLGFGPKLLKVQRGNTEYCVSAVPLGGYVKLAGETSEDERTGSPDEFLSQSKWVRFQVYLAEPVMNILLAWVVLAAVLSRGADVPLYESAPPVVGTVRANSAAAVAGLRPGDRILKIDDRDVPTWDDLEEAVAPMAGQPLDVVAERGGQTLDVRVTSASKYGDGDLGIGPILRPQVNTVVPDSPAAAAGVERGDVVVAIDGAKGLDQPSIIKHIQGAAGKPVVLTLERQGKTVDVTLTPRMSGGVGIIGVELYLFETKRIDPTLAQAAWLSVTQNWDRAALIGRTLRGVLTAQTPMRQLMGPVAIAQFSGEAARAGLKALFDFMALISLNLGLVNLLPVPVLDGGNIAILLLEGASRRDLSIRVKERILIGGAAFVILLMVTAIYNDVMRLIH